ncbi:type II secretion system protein [Eubacterium barkeri]|uniref:Prepilin-type N-terminal cleavage/methylation domain-containing protein n=1 Tax=Eubacterium barkeri TaxID=1528 RepID=A0A1H3AXA6_EUBBA|nr:type II secretion system protein [Eubacterium barkeri]SDX34215.1 prepilin-type N-terminal cleavage/methylation domain-containing protein [Eubacterium barkeri]
MKKLMKTRGFTLVEIIVVLVILAVIAAFTIPAMLGFVEDARGKAAIAEAREVYVAAQGAATELIGTLDKVPVNDNTNDGAYTQLRKDLGAKIKAYVKGDIPFSFGSLKGNANSNVLDVSLDNGNFKYPFTDETYLPQKKGCCLVLIGGAGETQIGEQVKVRLVSYVDQTGKYRINIKVNDQKGGASETVVQKKIGTAWQ